jgi:hypothetical protein
MLMQTYEVAPNQRPVVLLFDPSGASREQGEVDDYLKAHDLSTKRQYTETRGDRSTWSTTSGSATSRTT